MDRNECGSYKDRELINEDGVGEGNKDCMGSKDDIFLDCVRQTLVQRITPSNPTKPIQSLIAAKTNRLFQAKKEENNK